MKLFAKDILHRDISMDNVLLGRKENKLEAKPGYWGVLNDLHMAIKVDRDTKQVSIEWRTGSRTYLSVEVLRNCERSNKSSAIAPAQDHLDDLESFLYVYTHLIFQYDEDGEELADTNQNVSQWESSAAEIAWQLKHAFLAQTTVSLEVSERWPKACINVLLGFRNFIFQQVKRKTQIHDTVRLQNRADEINKIVAEISTHYNTVLCLFNAAAAELEKEERKAIQTPPLDPSSPTPAPGKKRTLPAPGHKSARNSLKRGSEELPDEAPEAKRNRAAAPSNFLGTVSRSLHSTPGKRHRTQLKRGTLAISKS
ncbi:hypothetical protein EST38_g2543 [Candolleomyces aberdarensis]|uniref:Protein kinase domain-containing protein n=1 Tax=Candolleomyces aberdarensis TaxID=2316362 RepID=A0A4Q2DS74_9AGAR|nr:hypothetical protein EST38_g2543 [Candolleomyces aberdarensis]